MSQKFFLVPVYGLANRLLMIASAYRLCQRFGYELVLIWSDLDHPLSERRHYWGNFGEYFDTNINQISHPLTGKHVLIPCSKREDRFVIANTEFGPWDIYLERWTHAIFSEDDFNLDPRHLTEEYRFIFKHLIKPSANTNHYLEVHYSHLMSSLEQAKDDSQMLGLHIRKGANIDVHNHTYVNYHSIGNIQIFKNTLVALQHLSLKKVFISCQVRRDLEEIKSLLELHGITVFHHSLESFPDPPLNNQNSDVQIRKSVCDFLMLSKSTVVMSTQNSTFGALAALISGRPRLIMGTHGNIEVLPSTLLSGGGL